jgi:hypothetical protein
MYVSDSTLERALLNIYGVNGLRSGGRLSIAALQRAWSRTGLRNDDFRDAVRILLGRKFLEVNDRADAMEVVLTAAGDARIRSDAFRNPIEDADLADLRALDVLRARVAQRRRGWDGSQRRVDDRPRERLSLAR